MNITVTRFQVINELRQQNDPKLLLVNNAIEALEKQYQLSSTPIFDENGDIECPALRNLHGYRSELSKVNLTLSKMCAVMDRLCGSKDPDVTLTIDEAHDLFVKHNEPLFMLNLERAIDDANKISQVPTRERVMQEGHGHGSHWQALAVEQDLLDTGHSKADNSTKFDL